MGAFFSAFTIPGGGGTIPAVGDVREGVAVGSGGVGTLELPDGADVRFGVKFGTDGTEFTGILVIPSTVPVAGNLASEMSGFASEFDDWTAEDQIRLFDRHGAPVIVVGSVSEFITNREFDTNGNQIQIRTAQVVLFRISNPTLAGILQAIGTPVIPNGWQFEFKGKTYRVANASSDELAFTFHIQHSVT